MPLMYRIFILELTLHQSNSPEVKSHKAFTCYYEPPTVAISLYFMLQAIEVSCMPL